jgi:hypothetical protein
MIWAVRRSLATVSDKPRASVSALRASDSVTLREVCLRQRDDTLDVVGLFLSEGKLQDEVDSPRTIPAAPQM